MLSRSRNLRTTIRRLHSQASFSGSNYGYRTVLVSSSGILVGAALWYSQRDKNTIHSDATIPKPQVPLKSSDITLVQESDTLQSLVWGSNRSSTLLLSDTDPDVLRTPAVAKWLEGVALRDLAVHEDHAACIDARGDVYQWGRGYFGEETHSRPQVTLRGKNIVQLQLSKSRLFALSASGRIYSMEVSASKQELRPGMPTPSSYPWWSTGWFWGEDETVDFVEIKPKDGLNRRESFKSISAGDNHLLALSNSGRVFAHPINKNANAYGQLGLRKVQVPHPGPNLGHQAVSVQLIPKSLASKSGNVTEPEGWKENDTIRFCPYAFEIPALAGIPFEQISAGARSSFARTSTGKVLGWGANDYGQIGLGGNVALDTITVPTEVILWRTTSPRLRSRCVDVSAGGDLTSFMVEYTDEGVPPTMDVLMCGNGQWGALGNNVFSNAQSTPIRTRGIGKLTEYDDKKKALVPILPQEVSVSASGHVLLTLDTSRGVNLGKDLYVWGKNHDSELGNGKKSSLPVPTTLIVGDERVMLQKKKGKVLDLQGHVWGKRVDVEQKALAGYNNSVVYWKIQN